MICRIAEFLIENNFPVKGGVKLHANECRLSECVEHSSCQCFKEINRNLTHLTFGWNFSLILNISGLKDIDCPTLQDVDHVIRIIHPVKNTVWIARKINDDNVTYIILIDGKGGIECSSIGELNYQLKDLVDYDGHKIEESWFD